MSTGDIPEDSQTVAAGQLRAFIERAERLNEEKTAINGDLKELFADRLHRLPRSSHQNDHQNAENGSGRAPGGGSHPRTLYGRAGDELMHSIIDYGPDTAEELYIKGQIAELERAYRAEAQPLIDRLCAIQRLKMPRIMVFLDQEGRV